VCLAFAAPDHTTAEPLETQKIITALTGDFNGDGADDLILIVETGFQDPFDVHFFLRDKTHNYLRPVEIVREQVTGEWNGYDGEGLNNSDVEPRLEALSNGSILLKILSPPYGRTATDQTMTIAYRKGEFIMAGFALSYWDYQPDAKSDPDQFKNETDALQNRCDYNVLTGKGKSLARNKEGRLVEHNISIPGRVIAFRDWQFSIADKACGFSETAGTTP
jgi:hypothetical protein